MLDTDTCSYLMKEHPVEILLEMQTRFEAGHDICISVITYSELRLGIARSQAKLEYNKLIMLCLIG